MLSEIEALDKKDIPTTSAETTEELRATTSAALKLIEKVRIKKSVKFADGVMPGEGTSPSGGEGDMPSPPPPTTPKDDLDLSITKKLVVQKVKKKQKRVKVPKTKKKVKVRFTKYLIIHTLCKKIVKDRHSLLKLKVF